MSKTDKLRPDLMSNWLKDFHTEEQSPMVGNGEWGPPWSKGKVWPSARPPGKLQSSVILVCRKGDLGCNEESGSSWSSVVPTRAQVQYSTNTKSYWMQVWECLKLLASTMASSVAPSGCQTSEEESSSMISPSFGSCDEYRQGEAAWPWLRVGALGAENRSVNPRSATYELSSLGHMI